MKRQRTGEKRKKKKAIDFKEAVCCLTAVVQGAAWRKNERESPG